MIELEFDHKTYRVARNFSWVVYPLSIYLLTCSSTTVSVGLDVANTSNILLKEDYTDIILLGSLIQEGIHFSFLQHIALGKDWHLPQVCHGQAETIYYWILHQ